MGRPPSLGDGYVLDPNGSQGLAGSFAGPWASGAQPAQQGAVQPPADDTDVPLSWTLAAGQ